jgi:AmmeMemoRadiSam system protein B
VACLRDRLDPEARPVIMTQHGLLLASLLDGRRTLGEVRAGFLLRTGLALTPEQVAQFVQQLDEAYLLDTPRAQDRLAALRREFQAQPARPAAHAGGAYPGDPVELSQFLEALYCHPEGPGGPPASQPRRDLVGLIAPHIDLHRGGPVYAWAYRALAESEPAELYVLLGTCHAGLGSLVAATRKPYDTAFGPAPTDVEFLEALQRRYGRDLYEDEYQHRAEHSLEFQALYLRFLGLVGGQSRARCVPLLCNALQVHVPPGQRPEAVDEIAQFVAALRETIAASGKRVCLIAGADLAHVGPQFGDPRALTSLDLRRVEQQDREMLELVCAGDAAGFYAQVMRDDDARRICGFSPIYLLLATLDGSAQGQVLRYAQWVDSSGNGSVSYAAVAFVRLAAKDRALRGT